MNKLPTRPETEEVYYHSRERVFPRCFCQGTVLFVILENSDQFEKCIDSLGFKYLIVCHHRYEALGIRQIDFVVGPARILKLNRLFGIGVTLLD